MLLTAFLYLDMTSAASSTADGSSSLDNKVLRQVYASSFHLMNSCSSAYPPMCKRDESGSTESSSLYCLNI